MAESTPIRDALMAATRALGPDFTCYTERDGGPWYIVAGNRESWHGAERVADTETGNRDQARAFALFLMGQPVPGFTFTPADQASRRQCVAFTCNGRGCFTAWRDACGRAFPATWPAVEAA